MKRIIEGKCYDTDTAVHVCNLPCDTESIRDFSWHTTALYQTRKGVFFLAGEGGPMSMWARSIAGGRSTFGGEGIRLISEQEARDHARSRRRGRRILDLHAW